MPTVTAYITDYDVIPVAKYAFSGKLYKRGDKWVIRNSAGDSRVFPLPHRAALIYRDDTKHYDGMEILHFKA